MRKILLVCLISILSISIMLGLFGCQHVHEYVDGVCSICNEVCEHGYGENGICINCGVACVHSYEDGECIYCGHEDVFALGVDFDNLDEYLDRYISKIRADSYVDFASTYDFNFETDPELYDQGMFWCYYDEEADVIAEVPAREHEEVDKLIEKGLIDGNKPTIIFVHGVAVATYEPYYVKGIRLYSGGHYSSEKTLSPDDEDMSLYSMEIEGVERVNLNYIYLKNGYNVINFVYQRYGDEDAINGEMEFADGTIRTITAANNAVIEAKVYATDGIGGMRYRYSDGTFSDQEPNVKEDVDFSMAEYFVAEYIRTFNYMVEKGVFYDGTKTVIKGHSMGGVMNVIGTFLISELIRVGQIPSYYLPSRMILEDSYLGVYSDYGDYVPNYSELTSEKEKKALDIYYLLACQGVTCHWTGKRLDNAGTISVYLAALRTLAEDYDIPIEYYVDGTVSSYASIPGGYLRYIMRKYVATAVYKFSHNGANSHNGIMELSDGYAAIGPIVDSTDENSGYSFASIGYALSTALTDEQIKALRGVEFTQIGGGNTDTLRDDQFEITNVYRDGYYPDVK